jgi:pyridoxamine 5'-phosphate oxidase
MNIADIRKDYKLQSLNETDVAATPKEQFDKWWDDAVISDITEVNAMTLATVDKEGTPSARIVLLKGYDENGFIFFTNYNSDKGQDLEHNPKASLVFFWKELERQVRISGITEKVSTTESADYFNSRPEGSRIGAWASPQSQPVPNKKWLEENYEKYKAAYSNSNIEKPPHWGGYRIKPVKIEFWQGRPSRMHDRILYTRQTNGSWKIERLAP